MKKTRLFDYCYVKSDFPCVHYRDVKLNQDIGQYKKGDEVGGVTIDYENEIVEFFDVVTHEPLAIFKLKPLEIEEN